MCGVVLIATCLILEFNFMRKILNLNRLTFCRICIWILFGLVSQSFVLLHAQQVSISGIVKDDTGEPIIGANVLVKGTAKGAITDVDGHFALSGVPENATLVVSYIGYIPQEMLIGNKTSFTITLIEDLKALDEVVVIGYGTQRKKDLTGAITTYMGDDLQKSKSSPLIVNALQGVMPGVTVTRSNGAPGNTGTIRVRGTTTIGTSDPYVLIDGVPGSLSMIKADDIESITVLKDAASASIYGAKAAAGVILVSTRRAKTGQLSLSYDYQFGVIRQINS